MKKRNKTYSIILIYDAPILQLGSHVCVWHLSWL